ncbi:NEDD4-binding protein 2-like isoform X2 [Ascaphus truei]|uniref:NEDD4-binding protein 2-like isoform X2 n=1 Tax=Ascaphus truei TaxID=8439 RepID=UPI003F5930DD
MPKKRKNSSVSPLRNPSTTTPSVDWPDPQSSSAVLSMPKTMSNNNNGELFASMCEMFSNLDPSLVDMVLSEYKEVDVVMDYLLELSTAAKEEAQVASTDKLGFDTIASFLDLSLESAGSSEILEQSSDELSILEESQTEVCKNMALTNDIDSMLDEALHRYSLSDNFNNTEYVRDSGQQYVSTVNTYNVAFPELINTTSNAKTSFPMQHTERNVQTLKGPHGDYKASLCQGILSLNIKRPDAGTRYNSASELTKTSELRKIGADLNTTPNKVSDSKNSPNLVTQTASEKIESGNSSVQRINQQGIQPAFTPAHVPPNGSLMNGPLLPKPPLLPQPVWNPMASPFYPDLSAHRFLTPVATSPALFRTAVGGREVGGGFRFHPPVPPYSWGINRFPPKPWQSPCIQPMAQLQPGPQIIPQNVKRNAHFIGKVLILLRGLPGSGKSTLARYLLQQNPAGLTLSTDDYFYKNGQYLYDPNCIVEAHQWTHKRAKDAFEKSISPIIIDNTNVQGWEMKPYVAMAMKHKYKVTFREPDTWWKFKPKELERRNVHSVTKEKITRMLENYESCITVNSILNLSRPIRSENADLGRITRLDEGDEKNNLMPLTLEREEHSFCSTDKTGKESIFDTVAGATSQSGFTNTSQSGCTSNISKSCVETLLEFQKESMTRNGRKNDVDAIDEQNSLIPSEEDTHNSDHVKAHDENALFSIKGSFEEKTAIEQDISNVDGASLLLCERAELLNFVGDWPIEQTMGQRTQRNRDVKIRSSLMKDGDMDEPSSQQLGEIVKTADSGPESEHGTVEHEVLFQAQHKQLDNLTSLPSECEIDIYSSGPCGETDMSELKSQACTFPKTLAQEEGESQRAEVTDLDGEDEISDGLVGDPQEMTEVIGNMQKMEISNDKEVETLTCDTATEKMPRQSKRYCRQCKLFLTFTNGSLKTEQSPPTFQSQETVRQTMVGTSKCSQTEPQEFALVWRIEKKKIDISDSIKVLTGKIDRFKAKSLDVNLVSESQDKIPYRVMHDQSTSVEENELISLDDEDSLNILSKLFRSVSFDVLKDLFERCNKDIVWATNLLLDSGENFHRDEDCEPEDVYESGEATPAMLGCSNSDELGTSDQTSKLHLYDGSLPICEHTDISWDDETEDLDNSHTVVEDSNLVHTVPPFVTEESRNVNDSSNTDVKNTKTNKPSGMATSTNSLDPDQKRTAVETLSVDMIPCSELKRETIFRIPDFITAASSNALVEQNTNCMKVHDQQLQLSDPNEGQQEPDLNNEIPLVDTIEGTHIVPEEDKAKQTNSGSLSKESLRFDHLELSLPPELAFQLSELFGPVGIDPGSLTIEDCVVRIDLDLAKAIHKRWKESITERHKQEALSYRLLFEDSSSHEHVQLDNMIQSEESKLAGSIGALDQSQGASDMLPFMDQWNTTTRKVSLRQIMSEEIALQEREDLRYPLRKDCASKLKEKQLFEMFPCIEQKLLMDIFKENNYSLQKTKQFMSSVLEGDPVQNVVAPDIKQAVTSTCEKAKEKKSKLDKDIFNEQYYQDIDYPEYDDFRAEAFLYNKKQQESLRKAEEAHHRGMKQVATYYAQQAYLYGQKMKASNHRAAMQIFQRVNEFLLPENILDLHGLHVDEAMKHFRQVLQDKSEEFKQSGGKSYLSVITGRGNHSQGGVARIKPAVIDYLTNHDFRFIELKPGVLRVTLK